MVYDFVYLLLLLTGIVVLVENRLSRIILFLSIQGFLLIFPVIQTHEDDWKHAFSLISLVVLFKAILTPLILNWTANKSKMNESTTPRFGYLATLLFMILGLVLAVKVTEGVSVLTIPVHKIALIYVILLVYVGVLCFVVRRNWLALIAGFCVFENGIFVLTMVLDKGLPFGLEFGSFLDAILVIVSGGILQLSPHMHTKERKV
ncbi:putative membrane protein [Leptospira yanagawae serovar Saopaulo str. Sao Paulo = ATCC 700523]|uniref:Putative membrane protein n=1 Tax=Leptospira yanagawae serovar Saopaulo str. Sao Paulo = ATCC 700523 TaxID=1249483 RepID=A0A5E8H904_9LEPT|nr:membrane protein [Leptospira yanagawae]EOQ87197.1 putative membrane protein [Leptospira yanagawae serovar Saopaulo str. Sao Paulo = ATCC 700523]